MLVTCLLKYTSVSDVNKTEMYTIPYAPQMQHGIVMTMELCFADYYRQMTFVTGRHLHPNSFCISSEMSKVKTSFPLTANYINSEKTRFQKGTGISTGCKMAKCASLVKMAFKIKYAFVPFQDSPRW